MPEKPQPTYVPFLDKLLGGGTAPQGVYGVLGPTGIGKTHLASMIACNGATKGAVFQETSGQTRPWVLFDLESHVSMSQIRILSHCAKVRRENIFAANAIEQPYEQQRRSGITEWAGALKTEQSRLEAAKHVLRDKLIFINGDELRELNADNNESLGYSMDVTKIISGCISSLPEQKPGGIVIDGVNNAWSLSGNSNSRHERRFILDFVGTFCRGLAEEYRCPVWVTHQVNGTACNASPLTRLSHSNAARCKGFADSLDACFVLGNSTDENFFAIQCTKGNPDRASLDQLVLTNDRDFASIIEVENTKTNVRNQTWNVPSENSALLNAEELLYIEQLIAKLP
ncbi:AAA family ATPase [Rubripirellula sp.]|nr:AAA family ATPase [Rubripirellula sp.]MDB4644474.1 AAA family ATPase [Rubripirellula sp.]